MSLDVALDIIGTLRMMKIDEISEEKDENKKELLYKELDILTTEEEVANGLLQFEVSEKVRLSIMDKIEGVTCTFHPNISPCVNLKNDGFSDFTGTLLSFIKK